MRQILAIDGSTRPAFYVTEAKGYVGVLNDDGRRILRIEGLQIWSNFPTPAFPTSSGYTKWRQVASGEEVSENDPRNGLRPVLDQGNLARCLPRVFQRASGVVS